MGLISLVVAEVVVGALKKSAHTEIRNFAKECRSPESMLDIDFDMAIQLK